VIAPKATPAPPTHQDRNAPGDTRDRSGLRNRDKSEIRKLGIHGGGFRGSQRGSEQEQASQ